jgi:hypothetical protein
MQNVRVEWQCLWHIMSNLSYGADSTAHSPTVVKETKGKLFDIGNSRQNF